MEFPIVWLRRFAFQCKAGLLMKVVCMYEHECKVSRVLSLTVFASSYTAAFLFCSLRCMFLHVSMLPLRGLLSPFLMCFLRFSDIDLG